MPAAGKLFVVATPLGNLEDFSPRAVRTLATADVLYAEDTRRSRILLDHYGIAKPLRSLHEHNEHGRIPELLAALERGENIALVTDAGTPAVSDPGTVAVAQAAAAGFVVVPIPGPSALTTALSAAGFAAGDAGVLFVGFIHTRGHDRVDALARIAAHRGIVVLFEAPHRLKDTLQDLAADTPTRQACVTRELTKLHEELRRGTLAHLAETTGDEVRGEITLVLDTQPAVAPESPDAMAIDGMLRRCLAAGLSARDASTAVAAISERARREIYARCQLLKPSE